MKYFSLYYFMIMVLKPFLWTNSLFLWTNSMDKINYFNVGFPYRILCFMCNTGFASSSTACLFIALLSHLPTTGSPWSGLVSVSFLLIGHHGGIGPLLWLLMVELSPVFHSAWAITLCSSTFWSFSLVQVIIFPVIMQFPSTGLSLLAWTGSMSAALAYVVTLWLVPDIRQGHLGQMEMQFNEVFRPEK